MRRYLLEGFMVGLLLVVGAALGWEVHRQSRPVNVVRSDGAWLEVWRGDELVSEWRPEAGVAYETIALFLAK